MYSFCWVLGLDIGWLCPVSVGLIRLKVGMLSVSLVPSILTLTVLCVILLLGVVLESVVVHNCSDLWRDSSVAGRGRVRGVNFSDAQLLFQPCAVFVHFRPESLDWRRPRLGALKLPLELSLVFPQNPPLLPPLRSVEILLMMFVLSSS